MSLFVVRLRMKGEGTRPTCLGTIALTLFPPPPLRHSPLALFQSWSTIVGLIGRYALVNYHSLWPSQLTLVSTHPSSRPPPLSTLSVHGTPRSHTSPAAIASDRLSRSDRMSSISRRATVWLASSLVAPTRSREPTLRVNQSSMPHHCSQLLVVYIPTNRRNLD